MFYPRLTVLGLVLIGWVCPGFAQPAPAKPVPNARFGNWLYQTPDPKLWKQTDQGGARVFSIDEPPGDFCTLTLFAGGAADPDFAGQFQQAVAADQKAKDTVTVEADSGAKPGKSAEGYDVLTRSLRAVTSALHTNHLYVAGHNGDRFDLAAFQTTSDGAWKQFGPQASQFLLSLKLANSLPPDAVAKLVGGGPAGGDAPLTLPGFDDAPPAPAPLAPAAPVPDIPLTKSDLVVNNAVIARNGKPIDGVKLSQHDLEISTPSIAVGADGTIHVAFVEKHKTTYALAVYYRASTDHGKTWTEAKNLSEEMPNIQVGKCYALVDGQGRVYVVWRAGIDVYFPAGPNAGGANPSNLVYRVLENGRWSRIKPVNAPATNGTQDQGTISYYAAVDAAGRVQVIWNVIPNFWHPELTHISGTYHQSLPGVGAGLVFQSTLNGSDPGKPREIYLTPVKGLSEAGGYGTYCDGLDALNGYVDASGSPHFTGALSRTHDSSLSNKSVYQVIENGQGGPLLELPSLSYHAWNDMPRLLVDAAGHNHWIAFYPTGEHPNIRDYRVGSDEEPVIIRAASNAGSVDAFQAYQGPNGRMVAIMEMNDSGERASGDTFVSISNGGPWSTPVNVTNNAGRRSFASSTHGALGVAVAKSYYPGPAACAFEPDGHLVLLMINNEYGLFGTSALSVTLSSGSSSTPTLQFLRF